jgi:catechol 2,3-dioxygenase-like lactoylglutathione lyase family enzyme
MIDIDVTNTQVRGPPPYCDSSDLAIWSTDRARGGDSSCPGSCSNVCVFRRGAAHFAYLTADGRKAGHATGMPLHWKIVIDCADPHAQAAFWAAALGYRVEDNSALIQRLLGAGAIRQDAVVTVDGRPAFRTLQAVRHPDDPVQEGTGVGLGRRLLFQQVPEPKTGKNRVHLDVHAGPEQRDSEVTRLRALGATVLREVDEPGTHHVVMADPEGNEFCVQ